MHDPSVLSGPPPNYYQYPPKWAPYCSYPPGAVVWDQGSYWRCEGGHTSGTPPSGIPANNIHLWTPISSTSQPPHDTSGQSSHSAHSPPSYANLPTPSSSLKPPTIVHEDSSDSSSSGETVTAPSSMQFFTAKASESLRYLTLREEEHKARDEDELKGELSGKRIWRVGGIGMWSYSLDPNEERKKVELWRSWTEKHTRDDWVNCAVERTRSYNRESKGVKPLVMWKFVKQGEHLPPDALAIGHEADGQLLYAVRCWFEGGLHLGKAAARRDNSASLSYGGTEHLIQEYEVLCGSVDTTVLKWMNFRHGERADVQGWLPVEGGREKDGQALLVAKGDYENGQHPGKCLIHDDHACIGYGGGEVWLRPFQVLAYNNPGKR